MKDNIDVIGWPTTAACPTARYIAEQDAHIVARLKAVGAIVIGKTNIVLTPLNGGLFGCRGVIYYGVLSSSPIHT